MYSRTEWFNIWIRCNSPWDLIQTLKCHPWPLIHCHQFLLVSITYQNNQTWHGSIKSYLSCCQHYYLRIFLNSDRIPDDATVKAFASANVPSFLYSIDYAVVHLLLCQLSLSIAAICYIQFLVFWHHVAVTCMLVSHKYHEQQT